MTRQEKLVAFVKRHGGFDAWVAEDAITIQVPWCKEGETGYKFYSRVTSLRQAREILGYDY